MGINLWVSSFKIFMLSVCIAGAAQSVAADEYEAITLAQKVGPILGLEVPCKARFDQEAVQGWIVKQPGADDMTFVGSLPMYMDSALDEFVLMTDTQKGAMCAAVKKLAVSAGFCTGGCW